MKKITIIFMLLFIAWCWWWSSDSWQWSYYKWWTDDTDIVWWPVFEDYKWCKEWALDMEDKAYNWYAWCSKNCHSSVDSTPICEEVVRTWHPLPWFWNTFDDFEW